MLALNEAMGKPGMSHIRDFEPAVDHFWRSMDGGRMDDCCCRDGGHHHWPAVDTGGIQHSRLHAAALWSEIGFTR